MTEPLGRDRVIYAPHMYTTNLKTKADFKEIDKSKGGTNSAYWKPGE